MNQSIFLGGFVLISSLLIMNPNKRNADSISAFPFLEKDSARVNYSARIELGKHLFYDKTLSRDSSISCATCHKQELAFTDGLAKSIGIRKQEVSRNSPTLTNVLNRPYLLLDGVNPSLEAQTVVPIQEHKEFDFNIHLIVNRLKQNALYVDLAKKGFDSEITAFVYSKSIAEFERTLISNNSPYDQYLRGNKRALSPSQRRGKELFFDRLYCAECHGGSDFTNDALLNNGLYIKYVDSGRMRLTEKEVDRAVFRVPTLRNIEVTGPYMHDGSVATLEEVIEHYTKGGFDHPAKGRAIVPFKLTKREKSDLVNFLKSLTDKTFLENPDFHI